MAAESQLFNFKNWIPYNYMESYVNSVAAIVEEQQKENAIAAAQAPPLVTAENYSSSELLIKRFHLELAEARSSMEHFARHTKDYDDKLRDLHGMLKEKCDSFSKLAEVNVIETIQSLVWSVNAHNLHSNDIVDKRLESVKKDVNEDLKMQHKILKGTITKQQIKLEQNIFENMQKFFLLLGEQNKTMMLQQQMLLQQITQANHSNISHQTAAASRTLNQNPRPKVKSRPAVVPKPVTPQASSPTSPVPYQPESSQVSDLFRPPSYGESYPENNNEKGNITNDNGSPIGATVVRDAEPRPHPPQLAVAKVELVAENEPNGVVAEAAQDDGFPMESLSPPEEERERQDSTDKKNVTPSATKKRVKKPKAQGVMLTMDDDLFEKHVDRPHHPSSNAFSSSMMTSSSSLFSASSSSSSSSVKRRLLEMDDHLEREVSLMVKSAAHRTESIGDI